MPLLLAVSLLVTAGAAAGAQRPAPRPTGAERAVPQHATRGGLPRLVGGRSGPAGWPNVGPVGPWSPSPPWFAGGRHRPIRPVVIVLAPGFWPAGGGNDWAYRAGNSDESSGHAPEDFRDDGRGDDADRPVGRTKVIEVGPTTVPNAAMDAAALSAEPLAGGLLRLRWTGDPDPAGRVTLVVADAARRVLASQMVSQAPFTAVFDGATRVAFVGVTVARPDEASTTTLVPLASGRTHHGGIP